MARAGLCACGIMEADQRPVLARLHDYRADLAWRREAALRGHHVLEGVVAGVRRRADGTAGDLHVLLTQGRDHVGGGEAVGGELLRIDPDPQRELALAEEDQIADAVESPSGRASVRERVCQYV